MAFGRMFNSSPYKSASCLALTPTPLACLRAGETELLVLYEAASQRRGDGAETQGRPAACYSLARRRRSPR